MADAAAAAQPGGFDLFRFLVGRIGIGGALQILSLLNPNSTPIDKGLGAAKLAGNIGQGLGFNPSIPGTNIPGIPAALAGAGIGYNLSQIAGDPNLSTTQKIGTSSVDTGLALSALYGPQAPYVAAFLAANAVTGQLEKSGSPQVAGTGRALGAPLLPINNFLSVLSGTSSPRAAANNTIAQMERVPIASKVTTPIMHFLGLGTPPTTGHMVREEVGGVTNQVPALKGFQMGQDVLSADEYNKFSPDTQKNAYALADLLGSYAPDYKKNQPAYQVQLGNSLLKQYGDSIPDIVRQVLAPPPAPISDPRTTAIMANATPQPGSTAERFAQIRNAYLQSGGASGIAQNGLQGIMDALR